MPVPRSTDHLVIGLGIAGINLCHELERRGRDFVVIDPCPARSASIIAGGIYNPVVIKRKVKTWLADALFPELLEAYRDMERLLGTEFLCHGIPIIKPILSPDELAEWRAVLQSGSLSPYLLEVNDGCPSGPFRNGVIGHAVIGHCGYLRIADAIEAWRQRLRQSGRLLEAAFDHGSLHIAAKEVQYRGITAGSITFCEGWQVMQNPLFAWLPLRPTKGQMLTVMSEGLPCGRVYNRQFYLFPSKEEGTFRLGATYEWDSLDEIPTQAAKDELLGRVDEVLTARLEVLTHEAGVRPNVADRRPLVGGHPEHGQVFLLNGMGSKGVMLAPRFARELVAHLLDGSAITPEADLGRFAKRYRKALIP